MAKEIERKWLIESIEIEGYPCISETKVEQAYVSVNPEVRIRNEDDRIYSMTLKDNGAVCRTEVELPITGEQYHEILHAMIQKPPILKRYRKYQLPGGLILEASEVDAGVFSYAEVEFASLEAALAFQPEFHFLEEVSEKQDFRMRAYWERTRESQA